METWQARPFRKLVALEGLVPRLKLPPGAIAERSKDRTVGKTMGRGCLPGVSLRTLKRWLVVTQNNGWSLTRF